ncbi:MAG: hypothetical protein HYX42_04120 [Polaromonas sp.]|uniref:beta barrel domain-containing protein n=1 Tax=Polaromonas sp. TaxID=1869339 RepID=UPI0025D13644|nr:hypothetical protein [Polaromonas sp.]MBI2725416.1 hypothetical protein [Polaromonas sp.]
MNLTVGQELYWVGAQSYSKNQPVTVTKVGRKWATLSNSYRIDIHTHIADGGSYSSPGSCYPNEAAYVAEQLANAAFSKLKNSMGWAPRDGVKIRDIYEAARLLGLPLEAA